MESRAAHEILERISDGVIALDHEWRYTYINAAARKSINRQRKTVDDLIGKRIWDEFPRLVGGLFYQAGQEAMARQGTVHVEQFSIDTGSWFDLRFYPTPDGMTVFFVEITKRKREEEALLESQKFSEAIADATPAILYVFDLSERRIVYTNSGMHRYLGFTPDEIYQISTNKLSGFIHPDDLLQLMARWQSLNLQTSPDILTLEYRARHRNGEWRWLRSRERVLSWDTNGNPYQILGIAQDVTEPRAARNMLRDAEERLRLALESANLGTWDFDPRSGVLNVDVRCKEIFSLIETTEITYLTLLERIHPEDRAMTYGTIRKAMNAESSGEYSLEYRVVWPDGAMRWVDSRGQAFFEVSEGIRKVIRFIGTVADITEKKKTEETLREALRAQHDSLALLDSLLANAPIGFAFFDRERRCVRLNEFIAEIIGIPLEEHLGKTVRELLPTHVESLEPIIEEVFTSGVPATNIEVTEKTSKFPGIPRHWLTAFYPVFTPEGEIPWVGSVVTEITDRKLLEEELYRRADALVEADRRKDEFLAMLGHELRNPLAPIRNAISVMKLRDVDDPVIERARNIMDRQVGQMTRLVNDLLDVSRIARGKIELKLERIDLSAVVRNALETSRPTLEERNHHIELILPPHPLLLQGDPTRLEQVVTNLLTNAAKFTDPGGQVRILVTRESNKAVIRVKDTGKGIPGEMLPFIFDLFTQVNPTLDRTQGGLGLGLTLVKRLVVKHGGTVEAQSEGLGKGSEFTLRLPIMEEDTSH